MIYSVSERWVNNLHERIKKLRKVLDLTQREFGERIGVKPNTIATYEIGRNDPIDAVISLICREFNVSEHWLRTGDGGDAAMFVQRAEKDELAAAVERLVTGESAEFKRRLVSVLSSLKDEHWLLLEQKLKEIVGMREAVLAFSPVPEDTPEETPLTIDEKVELYRQQLLLEEEREKQASSANESGAV